MDKLRDIITTGGIVELRSPDVSGAVFKPTVTKLMSSHVLEYAVVNNVVHADGLVVHKLAALRTQRRYYYVSVIYYDNIVGSNKTSILYVEAYSEKEVIRMYNSGIGQRTEGNK